MIATIAAVMVAGVLAVMLVRERVRRLDLELELLFVPMFDLDAVKAAGEAAELRIAAEQRERRWRDRARHALLEETGEYAYVIPSTYIVGELMPA